MMRDRMEETIYCSATRGVPRGMNPTMIGDLRGANRELLSSIAVIFRFVGAGEHRSVRKYDGYPALMMRYKGWAPSKKVYPRLMILDFCVGEHRSAAACKKRRMNKEGDPSLVRCQGHGRSWFIRGFFFE